MSDTTGGRQRLVLDNSNEYPLKNSSSVTRLPKVKILTVRFAQCSQEFLQPNKQGELWCMGCAQSIGQNWPRHSTCRQNLRVNNEFKSESP